MQCHLIIKIFKENGKEEEIIKLRKEEKDGVKAYKQSETVVNPNET